MNKSKKVRLYVELEISTYQGLSISTGGWSIRSCLTAADVLTLRELYYSMKPRGGSTKICAEVIRTVALDQLLMRQAYYKKEERNARRRELRRLKKAQSRA